MERAETRRYAIGFAFLLFGVTYMLLRWGPTVHSDFADYLYPAGKQALHGHLHYVRQFADSAQNFHVFFLPPVATLLLALVAWLPLDAAEVAWWSFGVVLMGATAAVMATRLTHRAGGQRFIAGGAVFLSLATFAPLAAAVGLQFDMVIVALLSAAFVVSTDRSRPTHVFAAGVLLGVAASLKLYPLLTLAVVVALRRSEARMLLAGAACAIASCLAITLLILGTGPLHEYAQVLSTAGSPALTAFPYAFGFLSIAYRALVRTPYVVGAAHLDPSFVKAIFALFVLCVLAFNGWRRLAVRCAPGLVWSVAVVVTAVCSPFLEYEHLAPLALIPVMLATNAAAPLAPILAGCVVCGLLSGVVSPGYPLALASLPVGAAVGLWLLRSRPQRTPSWRDLQIAMFGTVFVLLGSPGLLNVSAAWPAPMSLAHVALGSAEYVLLILVMLLMPSRSDQLLQGAPTKHAPLGWPLLPSGG